MNAAPMVSVCMISYGHENYIAQAVNSVMSQHTNFDFELIIANDCSPDATDNVVKRLIENNYPGDQIRYFNHGINKGMYDNFVFTLSQSQGKYIALCEGDDFWTDPLKLQKQVDFLEANPDYEVCFTNINIVDANGVETKERLMKAGRKEIYEQKDLPIWAPTLTRVFRNRNFREKLPDAPGLDTIMLLYQSRFGKIRYIDMVTGSYRMHDGGIYSSQSMVERKSDVFLTILQSLKLVSPQLYPKYFGLLFKKLVEIMGRDAKLFMDHRDLLLNEYEAYKNLLTRSEQIKIRFCFLVLSSKTFANYKMYRTFLIGLINNLLIYKH